MVNKVDFDKYESDYINIMNEQHNKFGDINYYSEQKANITRDLFGSNVKNILEFGCGIGRNLPFLQNVFPDAKIYGSDISIKSLETASNNTKNVVILEDNELNNDEYQEKFDLIFIAGVYHHIEPSLREEVTRRIYSLLSDNGKVICFEHNPYNPLTRHMVNTCEFDEDAVLLNKRELVNIYNLKLRIL